MILDLEKCMTSLAEKRPIFHSEADFQFALAWEIQIQHPNAEIRLEYPIILEEDKKANIDIIVFLDNKTKMIPIELKCLRTDLDSCIINNEVFKLSLHGAGDEGRYDCIKDINRIESISKQYSNFYEGYTIWLSNIDEHFTNKINVPYFNISQDVTQKGTVDWNRDEKGNIINRDKTIKKSVSKDRTELIKLDGEYQFKWTNFSDIDEIKERHRKVPIHVFKYCLTKINKIQLS